MGGGCRGRRMWGSSAGTRPCWRWTGRSTPTGSCCCTPWPGRASPPPRRSSPAGMPPPAASTTPTEAPGPVLWTSFEHHLPLPRVLDAVGDRFAPLLEANGIQWAAITDPASAGTWCCRCWRAVPVLWVWDNVEPVAGFPAGTPSAWTATEQRRPVDLLRDLAQTPGRRCCSPPAATSTLARRPAGPGPLPPMPMRERLQLPTPLARHHHPDTPPGGADEARLAAAAAVHRRQPADHHRHRPPSPARTRPTTEQIEAFVARVQAGDTRLEAGEDAAPGPRHRPWPPRWPMASTDAFTEPERAQLAVLHLFRDTVDADALRLMGDPDNAGADAVPALAGADPRRRDRAAGSGRRGRAAHRLRRRLLRDPPRPAVVFHHPVHPPPRPARQHRRRTARRARLRPRLRRPRPLLPRQVEQGRAADVLPALRAEEANLLHALDLARTHQLPDVALGCLQGLSQLYGADRARRRMGPAGHRHPGRLPRPGHRPPPPRPRRRLQHRHRLPGADRPGPAGLAHRHPPADRRYRLAPRTMPPPYLDLPPDQLTTPPATDCATSPSASRTSDDPAPTGRSGLPGPLSGRLRPGRADRGHRRPGQSRRPTSATPT